MNLPPAHFHFLLFLVTMTCIEYASLRDDLWATTLSWGSREAWYVVHYRLRPEKGHICELALAPHLACGWCVLSCVYVYLSNAL